VTCDVQNVQTPKIPRYYGLQVLERQRAFKGVQGQHLILDWTMIDDEGNPISLVDCGFASSASSSLSSSESGASEPSVTFRIREQTSIGEASSELPAELAVEVVDPTTGQVKLTLDATYTAMAGVYYGEFAVLDSEDRLIISNMVLLLIERGLHGAEDLGGPPRLPELRLHLRDSSPVESLLLDSVMFTDVEIISAITLPIEEFNETPPQLGRYTTQNFPFRYHWREAICGNLFLMVAEQYRRNQLAYSAGGISVDDQNKMLLYEQAAQVRLQKWRTWMRGKKIELNVAQGFAVIGSSYD